MVTETMEAKAVAICTAGGEDPRMDSLESANRTRGGGRHVG